ncbi:MAG: hypothetical protein FJ395_05755 [Verrucomicrobia bacterium]|nr:hypothetical protein [Verrucomicrobiota bacterium]
MKQFLVLAFLLACASDALFAADDPGAQYVDAFLLIQEGDAARAKSDWKTAYTKLTAAQHILLEIREKSPAWNAHLIQFRLEHCLEQLDAIKPNLAPSGSGLSATFVAPPKRGADSTEVRQLRADLADAMNQIEALKRELQNAKTTATPEAAELDRLRTQLAEAKTEMERSKAAHLTAQATLNKKEADEAARMAEVNQKIAELQKQASDRNRKLEEMEKLRADLNAANTRAGNLARQNKQLAAQLGDAKSAAERANMTAAELKAAQQANADLQAQLTEAKRLAGTGSRDVQALRAELMEARATADRSIRQQSTQLEQLRKENQTLALQLADSKRATAADSAASAELQVLRSELAAARTDTERARALNASQLEAWQRERASLLARAPDGDRQSPVSSERNRGVIYAKSPGAGNTIIDETLQRQNRELSEQLSSTTRQLEKLRAQLAADARANTTRNRKFSDELSLLKDQNSDLARQLAEARPADGNRGVLYRKSSYTPRSESQSRLEKENERLAAQLSDARRQVSTLRSELTAKDKTLTVTAAPDTGKKELELQMQRLREENGLLRQLLNRYAPQHPELKREATGRSISLSPRKP